MHLSVNKASSLTVLASQSKYRFDTCRWRGLPLPTRRVAAHPEQLQHPDSGGQFSILKELLRECGFYPNYF